MRKCKQFTSFAVKNRARCKKDKANAALLTGVYCAYMTETKRKFNAVFRRIFSILKNAPHIRVFYTLIIVPKSSPHTARTMESSSFKPKARVGTLFSMHMVAAVKSITFKPRLIMSA